MMDLRTLPPIDAASFFQVSCKIAQGDSLPTKWKKQNVLPKVDDYLGEEAFADVGMVFWPRGILLGIGVEKPFEDCFFPNVHKGDGVEIFIDTRGIENAQTMHKFCHHFVFLPKQKDGLIGVEVTRFRTEDKHDLCDPINLQVTTEFFKKGYEMQIVIPDSCLFGYDPIEYPKLRFAYRIHRTEGEPMHFPLSGKDYKLESVPSLWAIVNCEV